MLLPSPVLTSEPPFPFPFSPSSPPFQTRMTVYHQTEIHVRFPSHPFSPFFSPFLFFPPVTLAVRTSFLQPGKRYFLKYAGSPPPRCSTPLFSRSHTSPPTLHSRFPLYRFIDRPSPADTGRSPSVQPPPPSFPPPSFLLLGRDVLFHRPHAPAPQDSSTHYLPPF